MSSIDLFEGRLHNTVSAGAHADFLEPPDDPLSRSPSADEGCPIRFHTCDVCRNDLPTHSVAFGLTDFDAADPQEPPPYVAEICDVCIDQIATTLDTLIAAVGAVTAWAEDNVDGQYTLESQVFTHLENIAADGRRLLAGLFPEDVNLCPHNEDPRACWDCNVDPWVDLSACDAQAGEKFLN